MKGDRVEVVIDTGDGVRTYEVTATKAGRRVEITTGRSVVEVVEVTRTGTTVRSARFMASRVLALVEHPREESDGPLEEPTAGVRTPPEASAGYGSRLAPEWDD